MKKHKEEKVLSITPNDDGTFDLLTKSGVLYRNCYATSYTQEVPGDAVSMEVLVPQKITRKIPCTIKVDGVVVGHVTSWKAIYHTQKEKKGSP